MPIIIALILVVISGLVAAAGDFMGQRAARRKVRIGKLRPRYVSRLIAVASGIVISLATYGALFLLYTDYREALTQYGSVKQRYLEAESERVKAEQELQRMQTDVKAAKTQLEDANRSITELQTSMVDLVKEADVKRKEVATLNVEVKAKQAQAASAQAQADKAERELASTNKQLASVRSELNRARFEGAMQVDKLKSVELLPKDSVLGRVEIPAASAGRARELIEAELDRIKALVAEKLSTVIDASTETRLRNFAYPYANPPGDGVVLIVISENVAAGDPIPLEFIAQSTGRLLGAGGLLLELRIADTSARIEVPGQPAVTVKLEGGLTAESLQALLVETGAEFVSGMYSLGFTPPEGVEDIDLAAPVLKITQVGGDLLTRERPYIIQISSKADLTAADWPTDATISVFKEPGS